MPVGVTGAYRLENFLCSEVATPGTSLWNKRAGDTPTPIRLSSLYPGVILSPFTKDHSMHLTARLLSRWDSELERYIALFTDKRNWGVKK